MHTLGTVFFRNKIVLHFFSKQSREERWVENKAYTSRIIFQKHDQHNAVLLFFDVADDTHTPNTEAVASERADLSADAANVESALPHPKNAADVRL